uniref:Uncharacterized protein n=1 Tax=Ixodes ricinus TaxID=34613 RepID=A0A0K8R5D4_IXORI
MRYVLNTTFFNVLFFPSTLQRTLEPRIPCRLWLKLRLRSVRFTSSASASFSMSSSSSWHVFNTRLCSPVFLASAADRPSMARSLTLESVRSKIL